MNEWFLMNRYDSSFDYSQSIPSPMDLSKQEDLFVLRTNLNPIDLQLISPSSDIQTSVLEFIMPCNQNKKRKLPLEYDLDYISKNICSDQDTTATSSLAMIKSARDTHQLFTERFPSTLYSKSHKYDIKINLEKKQCENLENLKVYLVDTHNRYHFENGGIKINNKYTRNNEKEDDDSIDFIFRISFQILSSQHGNYLFKMVIDSTIKSKVSRLFVSTPFRLLSRK